MVFISWSSPPVAAGTNVEISVFCFTCHVGLLKQLKLKRLSSLMVHLVPVVTIYMLGTKEVLDSFPSCVHFQNLGWELGSRDKNGLENSLSNPASTTCSDQCDLLVSEY